MDPQCSLMVPASDLRPENETQSQNPAQGETHCDVTGRMHGFGFQHFYIEQREKSMHLLHSGHCKRNSVHSLLIFKGHTIQRYIWL